MQNLTRSPTHALPSSKARALSREGREVVSTELIKCFDTLKLYGKTPEQMFAKGLPKVKKPAEEPLAEAA